MCLFRKIFSFYFFSFCFLNVHEKFLINLKRKRFYCFLFTVKIFISIVKTKNCILLNLKKDETLALEKKMKIVLQFYFEGIIKQA